MTYEELIGNIFKILISIPILYYLWVYPIIRGVRAAKDRGISPHWMWFGIHPVGGWIAFAVIRRKALRPQTVMATDLTKKNKLVKFQCPHCEWKCEVDNKMAGMEIKCPSCSRMLTIPENSSALSSNTKIESSPPVPGAAEQRRPTSVTVIAILQMIGSILGFLGIPMMFGKLMGAAGALSEAESYLYQDPTFRTWIIINLPLGLLVGIFWIVVSVGLLRMRHWAHKASLYLLGYALIMSLIILGIVIKVFWIGPFPEAVVYASSAAKSERFLLFCGFLGAAIGGFIYAAILLRLLTKKKVMDAFAKCL